MAQLEADATRRDASDGQTPSGNPTLSSSLEHLVAGSQGVITKRIDLALLEARELLSRTVQGTALLGMAIILMAAAWLAITACVVLLVSPDAGWVVRLAVFGLLNGATAAGLVMFAMRHGRAPARARTNANDQAVQRERPSADGET